MFNTYSALQLGQNSNACSKKQALRKKGRGGKNGPSNDVRVGKPQSSSHDIEFEDAQMPIFKATAKSQLMLKLREQAQTPIDPKKSPRKTKGSKKRSKRSGRSKSSHDEVNSAEKQYQKHKIKYDFIIKEYLKGHITEPKTDIDVEQQVKYICQCQNFQYDPLMLINILRKDDVVVSPDDQWSLEYDLTSIDAACLRENLIPWSYLNHVINTITIKAPVTIEDVKENTNLPARMLIHCEWKRDEKWYSSNRQILDTSMDYCNYMRLMNAEESKISHFGKPLDRLSRRPDELIMELREMQNKPERLNPKIATSIVNDFNSLYPTWCFMKIPETFNLEDKQDIPYIRDTVTNRVINELCINILDMKANVDKGLHIMDPKFEKGYIPDLIQAFMIGELPSYVIAIVFNKSLIIHRQQQRANYGERVRIVTNTTEPLILNELRELINNKFNVTPTHDYRKCIINMLLPEAAKQLIPNRRATGGGSKSALPRDPKMWKHI